MFYYRATQNNWDHQHLWAKISGSAFSVVCKLNKILVHYMVCKNSVDHMSTLAAQNNSIN